jgi:hypothetical protein
MSRSKDAWLNGPGDLREEVVEDVPVKGSSVLVRSLPARYAADVQAQMKMVRRGREQVATIDVAEMEKLQFVHGCVDPQFSEAEAAAIQEKFGPAFRKVVEKIDELSGIDKEAIEKTEAVFQPGGASQEGTDVGDGAPAGGSGPDLPVRAIA